MGESEIIIIFIDKKEGRVWSCSNTKINYNKASFLKN